MAEWLGNGLQNRVQQFESAWNLEDGRRLAAICRNRHNINVLLTPVGSHL